jgi:hypothetical protein
MTDVSTINDKTYTKLHLTMREPVNELIQDTCKIPASTQKALNEITILTTTNA